MRDLIEACLDIAFDDPVVGLGREIANLGHRVMSPAIRSESVETRKEIRFENRSVLCPASAPSELARSFHQASASPGSSVMLPEALMIGAVMSVISSARQTATRSRSCQRNARINSGFATPVSTDAHSVPVQDCP
ncbi:hypothetical protein ACFYOD_18430 [Streptomyces sp. NPDC006703]|uniref:hypothetical protein n=1 Tax=Streptomyces sp. NPDC006703 TaxID=3364759 RepID=UPI0036BFA4E7